MMSTEPRPLYPETAKCDYCGNKRDVARGFGDVPFLNDPLMGGKYFCSYRCRGEFIQKENQSPSGIINSLLRNAGVSDGDSPAIIAQKLAAYLPPTIEQLPAEVGTWKFRITPRIDVSGLSCLMTGDGNLDVHTGPQGIAHTPMRVGDFALAISLAHPNAFLRSIDTIRFTKTVPNGTTVIIVVKHKETRGRLHVYSVTGHLADMSPICEPAKVTVCDVL